MRDVITIWVKELKDTVRDRRTLASMVLMPLILMPAIIVGMGKFAEYQIKKSQTQVVKVAIAPQASAPQLLETIKKLDKVELVSGISDLKSAVRDGEIDAGMAVPDNFLSDIASDRPVQATIVIKSTSGRSSTALQRLQVGLNQFSSDIVRNKLAMRNISASVLSPVSGMAQDVATEQERGGFGLGFLLPLFIVMWSITGGQYTAIDVSAGEKERKTLEALLLTPVRRIGIVLGKFLAVSTAALISVVVALSSLYFTIAYAGNSLLMSNAGQGAQQAEQSLNFSITLQAVFILLAISILLVAMFSAILLSIAIFARSFKEAQSYIGPAYLVVILPVVLVNTIPNFKPALAFFAIPAVNAILLFKEVLIGVYDWPHIFVTAASLAVCAAAAIFAASSIYRRESVLFKQ